jgi:hypothetical protein
MPTDKQSGVAGWTRELRVIGLHHTTGHLPVARFAKEALRSVGCDCFWHSVPVVKDHSDGKFCANADKQKSAPSIRKKIRMIRAEF